MGKTIRNKTDRDKKYLKRKKRNRNEKREKFYEANVRDSGSR